MILSRRIFTASVQNKILGCRIREDFHEKFEGDTFIARHHFIFIFLCSPDDH